jgi:WD40 repeat protein
VAFSPDGKVIVSGSGDGTMKLWDDFEGESVAVSTENEETPAPTRLLPLLLRPTPELTREEGKVSDHSLNLQMLKMYPEHSLNLQMLQSNLQWSSSQIFNGQQVDVLINEYTGRVLATRRPGDRRCESEMSLAH